jgi:glutamate-5-semialdehyde dehydrogenase
LASSATETLLDACTQMACRAQQASRLLAQLPTRVKDRWLLESAQELARSSNDILAANARDLEAAADFGLNSAAVDRLRLTEERIANICGGLRQIAALPDPIGETLEGHVRPNGLEIRKIRVPLGTVFFIYESRPNVTVDAAAICVKSGNAVILRGGKEAMHSSMAMVDILKRVGQEVGIPPGAVQLVSTTDRQAVGHFLGMSEQIDVTIPRGGKALIERVAAEARMPVIKHFDGNCHVYIDAAADPGMAEDIVINSKCQRMGVCNACESLLVHVDVAEHVLPALAGKLRAQGVEIRGDAATCSLVPEAVAASPEDWSAEYLGPIISCKVVASLEEAIAHVNRYGSHHTDAIVTNSLPAASQFTAGVDSSAVVVNASTRFNDGGEFGMGAEIGISTDKFHARGPCGLKELTTYKYVVVGSGQIRS